MVYHGPSQGCMNCRRRKVRCDLGTPRCLHCIRRKEPCSGPRLSTGNVYVHRPYGPAEIMVGADRRTKAIPTSSGSKSSSIQQYPLPRASQNATGNPQPQDAFQTQRTEEKWKSCWPFDDDSGPDSSTFDSCERQSGASRRRGDCPALVASRGSHAVPRALPGGEYGNGFFGVFRINPLLTELVLFWSRSVVHQMPGIRFKGDTGADLASIAWRQLFQTLYDVGHGYSTLAVAASHHRTITGSPHMTLQEKRYHTIAIRLLRERLNSENVTDVAIGYVKSMILAELASGDYRAATYHSKFLIRMLQPTKNTSSSRKSPPAAIYGSPPFVWCEMQRATKTFTKPLIDLDLYAQSLGRTSSYEQFEWSSNKASACTLDSPAIGDLNLIKLFAELNHYNTILSSFRDGETYPLDRSACIHLSNQLFLLYGRLITYCIDNYSAVRKTSPHLSETDRFRRTQHTAAALAALWWFRLRTRGESAGAWSSEIAVIERHTADGAHIHGLLVQMLRLSESTAAQTLLRDTDPDTKLTLSTLSPDFRLRLWTLYIGAMIERTAAFPEGRPKPMYCVEQLGRYMEAAGLTEEMPAVRDLWDGFLPLVRGRIYGPQWLNPVLRLWGLMH